MPRDTLLGGRRYVMSTLSHPPARSIEQGTGVSLLLLREMWASLAILAMWVAVAVSAVWGPDFVSTNGAGTQSTTIPSGVAVALFAFLGSWAVAKYAFGHRQHDGD
jgi:hypothetical protein